MTLDIAAIKARAEKASGAFITCVAGDGKPYVKFLFSELKSAQEFHGAVIDGERDIHALIAALEAERDALMKAAYLKGRTEWCPAGILDDTERTERNWQEARRALESSHE